MFDDRSHYSTSNQSIWTGLHHVMIMFSNSQEFGAKTYVTKWRLMKRQQINLLKHFSRDMPCAMSCPSVSLLINSIQYKESALNRPTLCIKRALTFRCKHEDAKWRNLTFIVNFQSGTVFRTCSGKRAACVFSSHPRFFGNAVACIKNLSTRVSVMQCKFLVFGRRFFARITDSSSTIAFILGREREPKIDAATAFPNC